MKNNNLIKLIEDNIKLLSEIDHKVEIKLIKKSDQIFFKSDKEQLSRVFLNLIKNSIESIQQKAQNTSNFKKKISIEITENNDHIKFLLIDNGIGFSNNNNIKEILNPYYTTKKNGTGLGLSIVNKIINDHDGELKFFPIENGAKIEISFKLDVN